MFKKLLSVFLILMFVWLHLGTPALAASKTKLNFNNNDSFYRLLGQEVKEGKAITVATGYGSYSAFPEELKKVIQQSSPGSYRLNYWDLAFRIAGTTLLTAGIGAVIFGTVSTVTVEDPTPGAMLGTFLGSGLGLGIAALASAMENHHYKVEIAWGKVKLTPTSEAG